MSAIRSKLTSKAQTVIPRPIRVQLGLSIGDTIAYRITPEGVLIEKAKAIDDPFAAFTEWSEAADEAAYATL